MKKNKYEIDMCNGTIMDKLISFSLPLMVSGILQLMFNAVDIIVVGRFSGSQALAAVGSTTALINVFINLFMGISLGANVLAARYYAAGRDREMSETVHTSIMLALISGVVMAFVGVFFAKGALELMDTPADVIDQSALYMRIYFMGMPFFMLYNYGAAILRAVGDTKRPLYFLIVSGVINAGLNMFLVIVFSLGVAGVAIATVVSQAISCVLVLRCLYKSEGSYQLRFSKLCLKKDYIIPIFQVGIPAGIQSTVINFSNVLLQSSVNSFGSIAMAGYTAANNVLGFLYTSVNSVTQACMSFTSQNYGVGKYKRMDKVLIDCLILSSGIALVMGGGAYLFGTETPILTAGPGGYPLRYGNSVDHDGSVFPLRHHGPLPGSPARYGMLGGADDSVRHRNGRNANRVDLRHFPAAPLAVCAVHFVSGIVDHHDYPAGDLLSDCAEESPQPGSSRIKKRKKTKSQKNRG